MKLQRIPFLLLAWCLFLEGAARAQQPAASGNDAPTPPQTAAPAAKPAIEPPFSIVHTTPFVSGSGGNPVAESLFCHYVYPAVIVPAKETLVLQQLSWVLHNGGGNGQEAYLTITLTTNGTTLEHWVAHNYNYEQTGANSTAIPLALYADAGSSVIVTIYTLGSCGVGVDVLAAPPPLSNYALSGYFTDLL